MPLPEPKFNANTANVLSNLGDFSPTVDGKTLKFHPGGLYFTVEDLSAAFLDAANTLQQRTMLAVEDARFNTEAARRLQRHECHAKLRTLEDKSGVVQRLSDAVEIASREGKYSVLVPLTRHEADFAVVSVSHLLQGMGYTFVRHYGNAIFINWE